LLTNDQNMEYFVNFKNISISSTNETNNYLQLQEIEAFSVSYNDEKTQNKIKYSLT